MRKNSDVIQYYSKSSLGDSGQLIDPGADAQDTQDAIRASQKNYDRKWLRAAHELNKIFGENDEDTGLLRTNFMEENNLSIGDDNGLYRIIKGDIGFPCAVRREI